MPPVNRMKTYSRTNNSIVNNSVDAFNVLFARNMTKRLIGRKKKKKLVINELPSRKTCDTVLVDDSLNISLEDTFDKVRKGSDLVKPTLPYQHISRSKCDKANTASSSDISSLYSPLTTRARKRVALINESSSFQIKTTNTSDSYLHRLNEPTVDKIDVSLEVEKVQKKPEASLSYIKVPTVSLDANKTETSFDKYNKFLSKPQMMSTSTPVGPQQQKFQSKIINHTISPIKNIKSLVEASFKEIKMWDSQFPVANERQLCTSSPKKNRKSFITLRRRKISKSTSINNIKKKLTVSLEEFNRFEFKNNCINSLVNRTSYTSYNLKNSESFVNNLYRTLSDSNLLGNRKCSNNRKGMRCSSGLDRNNPEAAIFKCAVVLDKIDVRNFLSDSDSNIRVKVSDIVDQSLHAQQELPMQNTADLTCDTTRSSVTSSVYSPVMTRLRKRTALINNSSNSLKTTFPMKSDLVVNISRLYRDCSLEDRSKIMNSALSNFENFYSMNIKEEMSKSQTDERLEIVNNLDADDENAEVQQKNLIVNITNQYDFENLYLLKDLNTFNISQSMQESLINKDICHTSFIENFTLNSLDGSSKCEIVDEKVNNNQNRPSVIETFNLDSRNTTVDASSKSHIDCLKYISRTSLNQLNLSQNNTSIIESSYVDEPVYKKMKITQTAETLPKTEEKNKDIKDGTVIDLTNSQSSVTVESEQQSEVKCLPEISVNRDNVSTTRNRMSDIIESSILESSQVDVNFKVPNIISNKRKLSSKTLQLKSGKMWRRSLSVYKRSSMMVDVLKQDSCPLDDGNRCVCPKCKICRHDDRLPQRRLSIKIVAKDPSPSSRNKRKISILEDYALNTSYVPDEIFEGNLENRLRSLSLSGRANSLLPNLSPVTARDVVLRRCGQTEPIPFSKCYSPSTLKNCQKIGEGVYGEVYLFKNPSGGTSVLKVIPIEGDLLVNGERQKKYDEILSEIVIAMELSNLRKKQLNSTSAFSEVQKIQCVQGRYPEKLLDLWDLYDETRGSENDCPDIFSEDQLYIVLQLANGGNDLESFVFNNSLQAYAMFKQVAFALAVAEEELHFEHRDLHWGNVLLSTVDRNKTVTFCIDSKTYDVSTNGVEVAIIDFTLSRIECDGVVIFNDLGLDPELFTADGDYQFDIYRLMQKRNRNNWAEFEPFTNVLWLHYILEKSITALRYKNVQSKTHKNFISKLKQLKNEILKYNSVKDFILNSLVL